MVLETNKAISVINVSLFILCYAVWLYIGIVNNTSHGTVFLRSFVLIWEIRDKRIFSKILNLRSQPLIAHTFIPSTEETEAG